MDNTAILTRPLRSGDCDTLAMLVYRQAAALSQAADRARNRGIQDARVQATRDAAWRLLDTVQSLMPVSE